MFHYVNLFMSRNLVYPSVVAAAKTESDTLFLDIGCCSASFLHAACVRLSLFPVGSEVRKLVYDGVPASRVLACDLRREYIDLGYRLYQDSATCPIRFFTSDIFAFSPSPLSQDALPLERVAETTDLAQLRGALKYIYIGALFHLFDEATQYAIAQRLAALLRRVPGAIVFGRHSGLDEEGMIDDHLGRCANLLAISRSR